jgi:spoIIIJ-associated protein
MEWVEVRGRTVDEAVSLGLQELGLDSPESAEIEVLQQPQRGFLGFGGQDALVRIKPRPKRRRRHRGSRGGGGEGAAGRGMSRPEHGQGGSPSGGRGRDRRGVKEDGRPSRQTRGRPEEEEPRRRPSSREEGSAAAMGRTDDSEPPSVAVEEQAEIVKGFLVGLLEAFGLEGEVTTRVEGDIIYADVTGDQAEALVGPKGVILDAVLEFCRTMVREALRIYAGRLAAKVLDEGGEVMLEPMNAADRKVVHDAVADIDGVRSFSEGEDPSRSVVIARVEEER